MKIGKRICSILLCIMMVFSLFSIVISADDSETLQINIKHEWNDADNQDGIRPDSVTVKLLANGQATENLLVLNKDNNWTGAFSKLPVAKSGVAVNYTVVEANVVGYSAEISGDVMRGFTIRNTHTPAKIDIHVGKTWNDGENVNGKRPQKITIFLIENNENIVKNLVLNEENHWMGDFTDVPEYKNGQKINYSIQEVAAGEYHSEISGNAKDGFVVTNTSTPEKIEIPVTLLWKDVSNQDGKRPDSVSVKLYADNMDTDSVLILNAENNWSAKFEGLPQYKNGAKISYSIAEATSGMDAYSVQTSGSASDGYLITNTHTPSTIHIAVTNVWKDADNQDGKRPESISVLLLANNAATDEILKLSESNSWSGKFENLPEYSGGQQISYKVMERPEELKDYTGQITGSASDGFVITNSHTPSTLNISVKTVWEDLNNEHGKRPSSVVITLLADNTPTGKTLELNQKNSWAGKFESLPEYKAGKQIKYTINETGIKDYDSKITGDLKTGFTVTNSFIKSKISISVKNIWVDNNDSAKARPSKIKIILVADGKDTTKTLELSASNKWSGTFNELDEYSKGKLIKYTIREADVKGYSYVVNGSAEKGYTITNTLKTLYNANGNKTTPDTGDHKNHTLWYVLLIVSCCGILAVTVAGLARKKHK